MSNRRHRWIVAASREAASMWFMSTKGTAGTAVVGVGAGRGRRLWVPVVSASCGRDRGRDRVRGREGTLVRTRIVTTTQGFAPCRPYIVCGTPYG